MIEFMSFHFHTWCWRNLASTVNDIVDLTLTPQIGDETFIIAALMAMRHPRAIVLSGALSALVIMTVS